MVLWNTFFFSDTDSIGYSTVLSNTILDSDREKSIKRIQIHLFNIVGVSKPGGVPGPTSELSPRAPAQMGRRKAEREGGKGSSRREADMREWIPRPSC
jgi:hypothetical protein